MGETLSYVQPSVPRVSSYPPSLSDSLKTTRPKAKLNLRLGHGRRLCFTEEKVSRPRDHTCPFRPCRRGKVTCSGAERKMGKKKRKGVRVRGVSPDAP